MCQFRGVTLAVICLELLPAAILCALFATVGIVHVSSRVMVVDVGYKLSVLEQKSRELDREHDRLKIELATLKSPHRLELIARERLGMVAPPAGTVISVGPSAPRLGRAAPALPQTKLLALSNRGG